MGIINVFKGLDSQKEIYNFNGSIRENLDLNWDYVKIYKGAQELDPGYQVQEDDIIIAQGFPAGTGTGNQGLDIFLGIITFGIYTGVVAYNLAQKAQKDMEDALNRIGKDNKQRDVSSIPGLSGARNERADGKNVPVILGKHLFAPYFLSEPYMRPGDANDGEDLYWYGAFLVGQDGLCFEKIRNGTVDLAAFPEADNEAQYGKFFFDRPADYNPDNPPPFYDAGNYVEIVQRDYSFTEKIFEEKWADSLGSAVELGRKKKDGAKPVNENGTPDENGKFMDDDGDDPVIRETARFPMRAEIEIMVDGLYGWDSKNGQAVDAAVDITLEWSRDQKSWTQFTNGEWKHRNLTRARTAQMRFLAEIDFPASVYAKAGDPVFIRATRKTREHTGSYRSNARLSAIRTRQYNPNKSSKSELTPAKNINNGIADKFCRLGIMIKVNKNTQEFMDRFDVLASMTGRTWDGQWSTVKTKTSNSAAVLLELITGLIHDPSKHTDEELDPMSFGRLYEFCAGRRVEIEGQGLQNFTLECNGVLTSGTRKIDAINSVLATCDGGLYINEFGKLEVYYEDTQTAPIALLNPQRIVSMVDQRSLERKADGYMVEFVDQESGYTRTTHKILRPGIAEEAGKAVYAPVKLDFTTGYKQAMWHARRLLAKEEHRKGELKCAVGKEGRYYKPGSLIKIQHERHKIGLGSGEIVSLVKNGGQITGLKLMERFDISDERDYWVEYYVVDGERNKVVRKQIKSVGQYTDTLMFTAPIDMDSDKAPVFGNILSALYTPEKNIGGTEDVNAATIWEAKRYIVTGLSENEKGYDLTFVEYAQNIYETGVISERRSSIQNAPPVVFADQQRNGQQLLLEALRINTSPQNINNIARQVSTRVTGTMSPRYRGVYYKAGIINADGQGEIDGDIMNLNDWVLYMGTETGIWMPEYCYRWTGAAWEQVPYGEMDKYMAALHDITEGRDNGYFAAVFCRLLWAQKAMIDEIQTKLIRIGGDKSTMILDGEQGIFSSNYKAGASGFLLDQNGNVYLNDVKRFSTGDLPLTVGWKRVIIEREKVEVQEYMGNNVWKTLVGLGLAAGLAAMSCETPVSSDAIQTSIPIDTFYAVRTVAYGNNTFVIGNSNGEIAYSANGINWTKASNSTFGTNDITKIIYANGMFIAVGDSGRMAYSYNGSSWTAITTSIPTGITLNDIAYGNGKFVVVGGSLTGSIIAYSTNGINWNIVNTTSFRVNQNSNIEFGDGKFIINGYTLDFSQGIIAHSTDGINWTTYNNSLAIWGLAYGNGKFIAGSNQGNIFISTDGINWNSVANNPFQLYVYAVIFHNGEFFAGSSNGILAHSTDGVNWTTMGSSIFGTNAVYDIAYGNGKFVVVGGSGRVAYFIDGETILHTRFGFTEKRVTAAGAEYKLSDGSSIVCNNNGQMTWRSN